MEAQLQICILVYFQYACEVLFTFTVTFYMHIVSPLPCDHAFLICLHIMEYDSKSVKFVLHFLLI